ncbi:MAG: response regulator [Saprospiraceae bacterium]|nr:response regulator [Pyrinomonadaceae bacterium]
MMKQEDTAVCHILCVEDDVDSCEMIKMLLTLSDEAYHVTGVHHASDAMELIAAQPFDLYVLDMWLPEIDGVELCRWIRKIDSQTPIIFFSAVSKPSDQQAAIDAGANAFLIKPNDLDQLEPTIERILTKNYTSEKCEV